MQAPFVLSIDWDFFVGDNNEDFPCDVCRWSCYDCNIYDPKLRRKRVTTDDPPSFDYKNMCYSSTILQFAPNDTFNNVPLVVADCHASIYRHLPDNSYVFNIDHHIDTNAWGSNDGFGRTLTCANWGTVAQEVKGVHYEWCYHQPLPDSNNPSLAIPMDKMILTRCERCYERPDLIFFCLSSPYSNPDLDDWFYKAIYDLSQLTTTKPKFVGLGGREMRKIYTTTYGRGSAC